MTEIVALTDALEEARFGAKATGLGAALIWFMAAIVPSRRKTSTPSATRSRIELSSDSSDGVNAVST